MLVVQHSWQFNVHPNFYLGTLLCMTLNKTQNSHSNIITIKYKGTATKIKPAMKQDINFNISNIAPAKSSMNFNI